MPRMDWKLLIFHVLLLLCLNGILAQEDDSPRSVVRTKLLRSRNLTLAADGRRKRILKSRVLVAKTTTPAPVEEREELTAELEVAKVEDDADLLTTISRTFETTRKLQTQPFLITETPIFEEPEPVTQKPAQVRKASTTTTPKPKVKKVTTTTEQPFEGEKKPNVETVRRFSHMNPDGSFTFGYENADGSFKEETRGTDCVVRGKYGYIDPDGVKREFTYVQGIPCVPGQNDDDDDEDDSQEERTTRRPVKVIKKKRPQTVQSFREEEDEIDQVLVRGQAPLPVPNTEVKRPLLRNPTTRQTSPTIPPTVATEAPTKATPSFTVIKPTTPKPQAEDVIVRDERPNIPFRPDPFRQRPAFDLDAEVQRFEQGRPDQPRFLPRPEQALEVRSTIPPRPEPFNDPRLQRLPQPSENPASPPPKQEQFRPPQPINFESELQRIEQERNNLASRPAPVPRPEFIPEQRFPAPAERPQEPSPVREQPIEARPPRPEPVVRPVTTTTTPRPIITTAAPRTTPVVVTTTAAPRPVTTTPRAPPVQPPAQSPNRPPFTFFGPVPPEFHQFGPPSGRPNQEEARQTNNRPPIQFRPEPQFNFLQRPDESAFPPRDQRTQDPRFNEAFRPDFPPPPPHFRPLEDPRFSQSVRGDDPRAPPQLRSNVPPQFRGAEERPEEAQRQLGRPEDPRQVRPELNGQPNRVPPFGGPEGFQPQQPRFGPPPPFTNFAPQQEQRFVAPQDPRFAQQPRLERPAQQPPAPAQRPQPIQGDRATAARGQIDQFLG